MKENLKCLICGIAIFLATYLIGAFIMADFNITHWTENARVIVGVLGGGCGIVIALAIYAYNYEEQILNQNK